MDRCHGSQRCPRLPSSGLAAPPFTRSAETPGNLRWGEEAPQREGWPMPGQRLIALTVNGSPVTAHISRSTTLLDLLRDHLGLIGVKDGCSQGDCGCCTILLNQQATKACLVNAARAQGADVLTVEGLAPEGRPHPLQQAFAE